MLRGIYTAASGMLVESLRMDVSSNNLANVDTAGFQKQTAHIYSLPETPIHRVHQKTSRLLGVLGTGALVDGSRSSFAPGALRTTGNPLDCALIGHGFFAVSTPEGTRYTRDGRFTVSESGLLATLSGHLVRGEQGSIYVGEGDVLINERGEVFVDGEMVDRLLIVEFNDRDALVRRGANLFEAQPEAGTPFRYRATVAPGTIELANVNVVSEMVNLINIQRSYEANQKVIQAFDETLGKIINEV
ncbi:MAG: flagellar basal-body rod protein FlgF [Bacillota bacterium]|nr:flagellar basal-body rod protein FlgF [Bacillota bacterium]